MADCGWSGVESVSAALVEACQPTERIRDTNIHRKHSPRYTDVLVFVNRWNKAESSQKTEAGRETQTEDREKDERNQGERGRVCEYRKLVGHLEAAHAIKQDVREYRESSEYKRGRRGLNKNEGEEKTGVRPIFQHIWPALAFSSPSDVDLSVTSNKLIWKFV